MSLGSGRHGVMKMAAAWLVAAGLSGVGAARFDEIRTALGLTLSAEDFGIRTEASPGAKEANARADRTVVIRAGGNGHYQTRAHINGRPIEVLVDTGATMVALSYEDAQAAGIFPQAGDFKHRVNTANGVARVASVMLDTVSIDDITVRNVRAVVSEPGRLGMTLLGMSFLGQLTRAEMTRGTLTLQE